MFVSNKLDKFRIVQVGYVSWISFVLLKAKIYLNIFTHNFPRCEKLQRENNFNISKGLRAHECVRVCVCFCLFLPAITLPENQ